MIDKTPLVSILIPCYNSGDFLIDAIESALNSNYSNFEVLISDDNSSDGSYSLAEEYTKMDDRVKVSKNVKNIGDYPNRIKLVEMSRGKYFKFVDHDDKIFPDTLSRMVSNMENNPSVGFGVSIFNNKEIFVLNCRESFEYHFFNKSLLDYGPTFTIVNREKYNLVGGFKTTRFISDWDLSLRMASNWPVLVMEDDLVFYREHDSYRESTSEAFKQFSILNDLSVIQENIKKNDQCPLSDDQKEIIIAKYIKMTSRNAVKYCLKNKNPAFLFQVMRKYNFRARDLIKGFISNN